MKGSNKKVTFEDMPELVSSLLTEVKTLQGKVDSVSNLVKTITPKDDVKILTVDDVCRWLGKSKSSVYKMTSRGEIPCYKQVENPRASDPLRQADLTLCAEISLTLQDQI